MRVKSRFALLAAAATLAVTTATHAAPVFINILTGGTSGVYYPIGVGLSQIYSDGIPVCETMDAEDMIEFLLPAELSFDARLEHFSENAPVLVRKIVEIGRFRQ